MSSPHPSAAPSAPAPATVLVVDDFRSVRHYHEQVLKLAGYTAVSAANGAAALERLRTTRVDLILLDLVMPEGDGRELLRRLAADPALARIPVLVISSMSSGEQWRRGATAAAGPIGFVQKPMVPAAISAEIERLLGAVRPS